MWLEEDTLTWWGETPWTCCGTHRSIPLTPSLSPKGERGCDLSLCPSTAPAHARDRNGLWSRLDPEWIPLARLNGQGCWSTVSTNCPARDDRCTARCRCD